MSDENRDIEDGMGFAGLVGDEQNSSLACDSRRITRADPQLSAREMLEKAERERQEIAWAEAQRGVEYSDDRAATLSCEQDVALAKFVMNAAEPEESAANAWRMLKQLAHAVVDLYPLQAEVARLTDQYSDLLMTVKWKHDGETRHETALRYIREAERSEGPCADARPEPQGDEK